VNSYNKKKISFLLLAIEKTAALLNTFVEMVILFQDYLTQYIKLKRTAL